MSPAPEGKRPPMGPLQEKLIKALTEFEVLRQHMEGEAATLNHSTQRLFVLHQAVRSMVELYLQGQQLIDAREALGAEARHHLIAYTSVVPKYLASRAELARIKALIEGLQQEVAETTLADGVRAAAEGTGGLQ